MIMYVIKEYFSGRYVCGTKQSTYTHDLEQAALYREADDAAFRKLGNEVVVAVNVIIEEVPCTPESTSLTQ